ncbi:MAG: Fur family transcriptional regulator [Pseudomonadota bacterium]
MPAHPTELPAPAFAPHDHAACISRSLATVEAVAEARGLRLTPVRRRTLEILLEAHRALGAYDVLARLSADGFGAQPPIAYRALDFLTRAGFAHRIELLNAFVACAHPGVAHDPAFLICRDCHRVAETAVVAPGEGPVAGLARALGFRVEATVIEAEGLCPACLPATP